MKTYIRPWRKTILIYLSYWIGMSIMIMGISFFLVPRLTNMTMQNTIFGPLPIWFATSIPLMIISPLLGSFICFVSIPKVYTRELNKGLFPMFEGSDQMMIYPHKSKNSEGEMVHPEWVESLPNFTATLTYRGDQIDLKMKILE